jgi:hypothetical protein
MSSCVVLYTFISIFAVPQMKSRRLIRVKIAVNWKLMSKMAPLKAGNVFVDVIVGYEDVAIKEKKRLLNVSHVTVIN